MNHRKAEEPERHDPRTRVGDAGVEGAAGRPLQPGEHSGDVRRDRLDTIEWADDRTEGLDPQRGSMNEDPIDDLLHGRESDQAYREEANRVTPTLGPTDEDGGEP